MPMIAGRAVAPHDTGALAGGAVVLICSFLTWFASPLSIVRVSGWTSGAIGLLAVLVAVAAALVVAVRVFAGVTVDRLLWGGSFLVLAGSGTATVLLLLKLLIGHSGWDRGFGLFVAVLGALVQTASAWFAFQASGEPLPWGRRT